ncbi:MAG: aromatic aminobenezylarsenical efflux permease ArsG family transporter [Candidatus Riflebacteria bacterium]|nr:aromatic aminobenezylarsenical efflux permease ArsG family transporter [Candidatus Riflebacteria bacterium]
MNWISFSTAAWLGVLTAISPCPLATNIAAISFIGRQVGNRSAIFFSGLLYSLGRVLAYVLLGYIITAGLFASGQISRFFQTYLNEALGPLLILLGMILLNMIGSGIASFNLVGEGLQQKAAKHGALCALPLGTLFALSFCPVSAGLFFGALIPLTLKSGSALFLPAIYGVFTAIPVVIFAFLIAYGGEKLGKAYNNLSKIQVFVRDLTGTVLIIVGTYYSLTHIYGVNLKGLF